jgi:hypothetical protein
MISDHCLVDSEHLAPAAPDTFLERFRVQEEHAWDGETEPWSFAHTGPPPPKAMQFWITIRRFRAVFAEYAVVEFESRDPRPGFDWESEDPAFVLRPLGWSLRFGMLELGTVRSARVEGHVPYAERDCFVLAYGHNEKGPFDECNVSQHLLTRMRVECIDCRPTATVASRHGCLEIVDIKQWAVDMGLVFAEYRDPFAVSTAHPRRIFGYFTLPVTIGLSGPWTREGDGPCDRWLGTNPPPGAEQPGGWPVFARDLRPSRSAIDR